MYIKRPCNFHQIPSSHSRVIKKFYDLLGQPSYLSLHKLARNFLKFSSNRLKQVGSVLKLDTKYLKTRSGLTGLPKCPGSEISFFGETPYLLSEARHLGQ